MTAATGDVEELTPAQGRTVLNVEDGSQKNQQAGWGYWTKNNDTIGTPGVGLFDVNHATPALVTQIRLPNIGMVPTPSVEGAFNLVSPPAFLQLQDTTDPLGTQVTFLVTDVVDISGIWADYVVVAIAVQGTNWSANPYSVNWTTKVDAGSHVRRDVSNTADGVQLLQRAASPQTPVATKAHIWVKNEDPSELFITDDAGRNQNVSWWMNNLSSHMAHYGIWLNLQQTAVPFSGTIAGDLSIEYNDNADKFYCTYFESAGSDGYAYDSDNGINWSSLKIFDTGTSVGDMSQAASDGTHFGIACDQTFYRSTDLTVANTVAYGTFSTIGNEATGLIYDHTNSLWVVCGNTGTQGYIETSPTGVTGTWTLRKTLATGHMAKAMDWDPVSGRAVVVCGSTSLNTYYSTNKTSWTQDTTGNPSIGCSNIWFSKQHDCFFAGDSSQNMHMTRDNNGGTWFTISGMDASHVWRSDDFMCFTGGGSVATIYQMGATGRVETNQTMTKTISGYIDDYNFQPILNTATQRCRIRGGKGVIAWPSYSNNKLMYARYAPPPLT